ncbi:hypothetical protein GIB67_014228 [Kingdonia uniflora]|uniref:TOD1/MUCI70 glycosyltransferase-like domain-containing protein n=1 Tax=Kingdonia uniflora TaxID=39325 RepID=A0A7J7M1X6_9MAGN|nr:hypothetical protein GIB67_014228 [Kingdonia uniflora]
MNVHYGFLKRSKPGQGTRFDIDDADLFEMEYCNGIVVTSAIFGNYDIIQQPKNISEAVKENVCFYMFVEEETEAYMKNSSSLNEKKKVGIWRVVIVRNFPYKDARRNGKVPKFLPHRIFPNARYSIWIDGKLELIVDPYQILKRFFIWRERNTRVFEGKQCTTQLILNSIIQEIRLKFSSKMLIVQDSAWTRQMVGQWNLDAEFRIKTTTKCKWEPSKEEGVVTVNTDSTLKNGKGGCGAVLREAIGTAIAAAAGNLNTTSVPLLELNAVLIGIKLAINHGRKKLCMLCDSKTVVEFYKREGLTPYSEAKLPITSDVPEGRVIIKEHIPITNLLTYLRFNEVDRFTSRDQISFSTVRDKIMSKVNWSANMFIDCERCNFVVQGYHRDLLEHMAYSLAVLRPPPPPPLNKPVERSPPLTNEPVGKSTQEATEKITKPLPSNPGKRRRKSSSKHHRMTGGGIKDRIIFKHIFSSILC